MRLEENKIFERKARILVYLVKNEYHQEAFNIIKKELFFWMQKIILRNLKKFPNIPINYQDLLIYLDLSLLKSALQFETEYKVPFKQFAIQQFNWFLLSYLRIYVAKKYFVLNYSSDYDESDYRNENFVYHKTFNKKKWEYKKNQSNIIYLKNNLSKIEKEIFNWKEKGYQNKEIIEKTKFTKKQIDNTWGRIKSKIKLIKI